MRKSVLAGSLALAMLGAQAQQPAGVETAQQGIPDAPRPQPALSGVGTIAPGKGATTSSSGMEAAPADAPSVPATTSATSPQTNDTVDTEGPVPTEGRDTFVIRVRENFVDVPFTVKDSKGRLIAGLTSRDVRVYENGLLQHISDFTVDPYPLSVALVIDQSMTHDNMTRVNDALSALQGAFAPYDEVALFTYNNGPKLITAFTASQSARLTQAVETSKTSGREPPMAGSLDGPIAQTTVINGQNFDPNTAANRGHSSMQLDMPKEVHTLNDAILAAATALSRTSPERRRVIYVISDGKEAGSQAKYKDVVRYLQTHKIAVYGTLVGDSAVMGIGFLDRIHLPLMMRDNILPAYAAATGGNFDAEFRTRGIEKSFAEIAKEVRTQYTLGYYTREPFIDGKYRSIEVRIINHGNDLNVLAKKGYWPSAMDVVKPHTTAAAQ